EEGERRQVSDAVFVHCRGPADRPRHHRAGEQPIDLALVGRQWIVFEHVGHGSLRGAASLARISRGRNADPVCLPEAATRRMMAQTTRRSGEAGMRPMSRLVAVFAVALMFAQFGGAASAQQKTLKER